MWRRSDGYVQVDGRDVEMFGPGTELVCANQTASVRFARLINAALVRAGSPKRLFYMNGYNDLSGALLTRDVFQVLESSCLGNELWNGDDGAPVEAPVSGGDCANVSRPAPSSAQAAQ